MVLRVIRVQVLLLFCLTLNVNLGGAQSFNKDRLLKIYEEQHENYLERQRRVDNYLSEHSAEEKVLFTDPSTGEYVLMYDVVDGVPQYKSTFNKQARLTTGVDYVQSANGLNLPLFGQDLKIGVWDGGLVLSTHKEFGGRVFNKLGSSFSNHATHVTGTIAAAGVNPDAKGMLPQVTIDSYYAFENDLGPMAEAAANGLILSNHSYGLVLGWNYNQSSSSWQWLGGADNVDQTFGAYTNNSRSIDEIAYNAPFYTIVWAAGNDRSDVGDGTRPPDGPYDIIGPSAGAKNNITVGAITGFNEYVDNNSAEMSSFSSWGPTNDGRIKPDIVADGVGVLSCSSSNDSAYVSLQGTSMASPNTTGTLGLIQQFYKERTSEYMTSAQLKSLVIHTAREAGSDPGPDYKFGWGVVNAIAAVDVISHMNTEDTVLLSKSLVSGEMHEYELFSDGLTPINATITWTDVPGTVRAETSKEPSLVNDLDIKLVDDLGNEVYPWILDPSAVSKAAQRGVNNIDNVERIQFLAPQARKYKLIVSHKGSLVTGAQQYALSLTYNAASISSQVAYWINGSGNFSSNANFSVNSGGNLHQVNYDSLSTLIIDENSFTNDGIILFEDDMVLKNIVFSSDDTVSLDLGGNSLTISSPLYLNNDKLKIINGTLNLAVSDNNEVKLNFDGSDNLKLILRSQEPSDLINISTNIKTNYFELINGNFSISNKQIDVSDFNVGVNAILNLTNNNLDITDSLKISGVLNSKDNKWILNSAVISSNSNEELLLEDAIINIGTSFIQSPLSARYLENGGDLFSEVKLSIDSVTFESGSKLTLTGMDSLIINSSLRFNGKENERVQILGDPINKTNIILKKRQKICVDFLYISNVNFVSESILNLGENSISVNNENILTLACEEVLFADFSLNGSCANSLIPIKNLSSGNINTYKWSISDSNHPINGVSEAEPVIWFDSPGVYEVNLELSNDIQEEVFSQNVTITENDVTEFVIIENENGLVASANVQEYQWYFNGILIENENARILTFPLEVGQYNVAYLTDTKCGSNVSSTYQLSTITSNKEQVLNKPTVFPNPFNNFIKIENLEKGDELMFFDAKGTIVRRLKITSMDKEMIIDFKDELSNLYFLQIIRDGYIYNNKLIKR